MKKSFNILKDGIAFLLGALVLNPYRVQMGAASLPVIPTAANVLPVTLAVAQAIKPTETVGSLAVSLLNNKGTLEDRAVTIHQPGAASPARVMLHADPANGTPTAGMLGGGTLIATITRDDATKETTSHSAVIPDIGAQDQQVQDIAAAIEAALAAQKPRRNLASLINAVDDAINGITDNGADSGYGIVFFQQADGTVKVYAGADAGSGAAKLADVSQEAAPAATVNPLW